MDLMLLSLSIKAFEFEFSPPPGPTQVLQQGDKLTVLVKVHLNSDSGVFAQGLFSLQKCT